MKKNYVTLVEMGADEADVNITDGSTVTAVEFVEWHGRSAMNITIGDTVIEGVRLGSDTLVTDAAGTELGTLLDSPAGQVIAKAGWNFFLIEGDGSHGVHNPSFTMDVINATIAALPAGVLE